MSKYTGRLWWLEASGDHRCDRWPDHFGHAGDVAWGSRACSIPCSAMVCFRKWARRNSSQIPYAMEIHDYCSLFLPRSSPRSFPIGILGELVSIGTLLAFVIVCAGVWVLRRSRPDLPRRFQSSVRSVCFDPAECWPCSGAMVPSARDGPIGCGSSSGWPLAW